MIQHRIHRPGMLGLVLKCSQNPTLRLNKVRFLFYFEVYRIKHGKSGAKKKLRVRGGALKEEEKQIHVTFSLL